MNEMKIKPCKPIYYNPADRGAVYNFCTSLRSHMREARLSGREIVFICIGSDRATGDCLGPLIGYKLSKFKNPGMHIYGTLSAPVHAKNLSEVITAIYASFEHPYIIAIDASLGIPGHIGYVTLAEGSLAPGIGVDKELPQVGDIHITGIVNLSGLLNNMLLQTTRLDQVMKLADFICAGIRYAFSLS